MMSTRLTLRVCPSTRGNRCDGRQPIPVGFLPTRRRDWLVKQYHRVRRSAKIISAVSNVISGLLAAVIESIMIYVLYKFYSTRDIFMEDRPWGPWAKDRVVWPTFMFAAASIVTSLIALVALIALCWRSKRRLVFFSLVYVAMDIITWVIVAIVYRVEKTEKDLWGWSCTDKAKAIQQQLGKQADFTSLCKLQVILGSVPKPYHYQDPHKRAVMVLWTANKLA